MADSDKDILITPNTGAASDPSIVFSSGATGGDDVTLNVTDDGTITTLSIEGSAGQLFAITNDLTGTIFAVNDVSGIPSIEVDADGTIRLAEFDGDVGIGQGTPTHKLHITGPTTANTHTGIFVDSTGDAYLDLRADNTTGGAETNNPYVRFRQDQDAVETVLGHNNSADDALGNAVTNGSSNAFMIHNRFATGTIELAVNGSLGAKVDDSNNLTVYGDIFPSGQTSGKIAGVTGQYGAIQTEGSTGGYGGVSMDGNFVLMNSGSAHVGLYDDINNEWFMIAYPNSYVQLYHNGVARLTTSSAGTNITGELVASTRLACSSSTEYFDTQVFNTTGITSSAEIKDHNGNIRDVGFNHVQERAMTSSSINPIDDIHAGAIIRRTSSSAVSITLGTGSQFPIGSMCTVINHGTGGSLNISDGTAAMYILDGSGTVTDSTGFNLAIGGVITIWRQATSVYYVWGAGIP